MYSELYDDIDSGDWLNIWLERCALKCERWSSTVADPDSMSAVVGGCEGDGESRVHSRFLLLMNGLEMKPGLGGRFSTMVCVVLLL